MSIQSLISANSLVAAGIGIGDVVTIYTLGRRIGNWTSAESGDRDLLALLEEDETSILKRRGVIDIVRFKSRWGKTLRLLENGVPHTQKGHAVEKLLESSSRFTVMMTCIVAALDTFAADCTVRIVIKTFLQRLIPTPDFNEDAIVSQLGSRMNSWRSSAAVRDMNIFCRRIWDSLRRKQLIVNGNMPKEEANEVADVLHWIVCGKDDATVRHTSSSDVAGIVLCLTNLSFEILSVENFGPSPTSSTICQLIYDAAPLFVNGRKQITKHPKLFRDLSTAVSLTQPEETFSTFPISRKVANRCRLAWEEGMKAGKGMRLAIATEQHRNSPDVLYELKNVGDVIDPISGGARVETKFVRIVQSALGFSTSQVPTITKGIASALSMEKEDTLNDLAEIIQNQNPAVILPKADGSVSSLEDNGGTHVPTLLEAFHTLQAFIMGFYYEVFLQIVDTTKLAMESVSGTWGYRSLEFLRNMKFIQTNNQSPRRDGQVVMYLRRSDILSILAILFANPEESRIQELPAFNSDSRTTRQIGMGYVGKRIVLPNSLLKDCLSIEDIAGFTLLDTDAGAIPHNPNGLIEPGIASNWRTYDYGGPPIIEHVQLHEPPNSKGFTRHIQPDWDNTPERLLLCIRYQGRRVGVLDPVLADYNFIRSWTEPTATELPGEIGGVHDCDWEKFVSQDPLPTASSAKPDIPVIVHTKNCPCLRYAALAWYDDSCAVAQINGCMHTALKHAQETRRKGITQKYLVLIG